MKMFLKWVKIDELSCRHDFTDFTDYVSGPADYKTGQRLLG